MGLYVKIKKDFGSFLLDTEFEVQEEVLGILGESGCGKSTLGRTLIRMYEPTGGQIIFDGEDITKLEGAKLQPYHKRMQIIFQDPYSSLDPRHTAADSVEEPMIVHKTPATARERQERTIGLFKEVGLDMQHLNRYPHEFSGGQRQRLNIARAIASNPRVVICDEPVSALDVSVQAQIVNLLKKIQRERKLASIFISHDINVVRYISDRIVVMYLGHIVEEAPKDELIHHPKHPYTKSLLASVPNMNPRERKRHVALEGEIPSPMDPPSGCVFHTRCPYATDKCRTEVPEYKESGDGHWVRCHEV